MLDKLRQVESKYSMLDKLRQVESKYEALCARSEQPDFYADPQAAAQNLREQRELEPVVGAYRAYMGAKARMDAAFRALTEGGHFSYDPDADPVYQAYASRYLREGRAAMEDTLGRTASLTGGYGSSYASAAAQQMYEAYLGRLHDVLPELYSAAWKRHREQQSDKAAAYGYARADADKAYDRAYDRWEKQLGLSRED